MPRRSRRTGSWLAIGWVAGTVTAVLISIVAIHVAGSKVTTRPIDVVSKKSVEDALIGDATVVVRDPGSDDTADSSAPDDHGGSESGRGDSSGSDESSGSSGSGSSSGSRSGESGSSDGGGSSEGGGGSGSDGSGGSDGGGSKSTATTEHEQSSSPTTTAAPSSPVSKTVSGNTVTIRCTGDTIALVSSTAASGFSKQIDKSGPQEVSVQFTNHQTDAEVELQAQCSHGTVSWSS